MYNIRIRVLTHNIRPAQVAAFPRGLVHGVTRLARVAEKQLLLLYYYYYSYRRHRRRAVHIIYTYTVRTRMCIYIMYVFYCIEMRE